MDSEQICYLGSREGLQRFDHLQTTLNELSYLYRAHVSMDSLLPTSARVVVEVLGLDHCSIAWLNTDDGNIKIRASHTREGVEVKQDQVLKVLSGLINRQPPNSKGYPHNQLNGKSRVIETGIACEVISPLRINKQIVGYICGLKNDSSGKPILEKERSIFTTMSKHISLAIEVQHTREMLDSPYISLSLTPIERESLAEMMSQEHSLSAHMSEPRKLVNKIARRFFVDLRRAGFEIKQILWVATEILDSMLAASAKRESVEQSE